MAPATESAALHPAMPLRRYVEPYVYVDTQVSPRIVKPLSPRPEAGIAFNLNCRDRLTLEYGCGRVVPHPPRPFSDRYRTDSPISARRAAIGRSSSSSEVRVTTGSSVCPR